VNPLTQTSDAPTIGKGAALIFTVTVLEQPVPAAVYVTDNAPGLKPVTIPVVPTEPTVAGVLDHVPRGVEEPSVVVPPLAHA